MSHSFKRMKTTIANHNPIETESNEKTSSSRNVFHKKTYSMAPTTFSETLNSSSIERSSKKLNSQKKSTKRFSTLMKQSMDILSNKKPIIVKKVAFGNILDQKPEEFKNFEKKKRKFKKRQNRYWNQ